MNKKPTLYKLVKEKKTREQYISEALDKNNGEWGKLFEQEIQKRKELEDAVNWFAEKNLSDAYTFGNAFNEWYIVKYHSYSNIKGKGTTPVQAIKFAMQQEINKPKKQGTK